MKRYLAIALCAMSAAGCQKEKAFDDLVVANKKLYEEGASAPYTGRATGIPYLSMPLGKLGLDLHEYERVAYAAGVRGDNDTLLPVKRREAVCDAEFEDGVISGETTCMPEGTTQVILRVNFKDGLLDGPYAVYDIDDPNLKLFEGSYDADKRSGKNIIRARENGEVLKRWTSSETTSDPIEEFFVSGKKRKYSPIQNGKVHGEVLTYREDETLLRKTPYVDGFQHGWVEWFDPESQQFIREQEYLKGEFVPEVERFKEALNQKNSFQAYMLRPGIEEIPRFEPLGEPANSYIRPGQAVYFIRCEGKPTRVAGTAGRWCLVQGNISTEWTLDTFFEPATVITDEYGHVQEVYPTSSSTKSAKVAASPTQTDSPEYREAFACAMESYEEDAVGPAAYCVGNSRDPSELEERAYEDAKREFDNAQLN